MNNKSQQIYSLLKKTDLFYQLIKKAVPLDEGGLVISPHLSSERMNEIPAIKDYIKHYSNTKILYRIIYCNSEFNLTTRPITVSSFIASLKEKIKTSSMSGRDEEEAQYLLDNNAFNQNAINIIANKLSGDDLIGPEAVDHDIAHQIVDNDDFYQPPMIEEEIKKDYHIINNDTKKIVSWEDYMKNLSSDWNSFQFLNKNLAIYTIIKSNPEAVNSVSSFNFKKDQFVDLLPDLLVYYNRRGENLSDMQIIGQKLYNSYNRWSTVSKNKKFTIAPKNEDGSVPNIEKKLKEYLNKIDQKFKEVLQSRVGKVFLLW